MGQAVEGVDDSEEPRFSEIMGNHPQNINSAWNLHSIQDTEQVG